MKTGQNGQFAFTFKIILNLLQRLEYMLGEDEIMFEVVVSVN